MLGRKTKSRWARISVIISCLAVIIASMGMVSYAGAETVTPTTSTTSSDKVSATGSDTYVLVAAKGSPGNES